MAVSVSSATLALPLFSVGDSSPHLLPASFLSRLNTGAHSRQASSIRCQAQNQISAVIPVEQRWMFDESEANGPDIWNKTWYPKAADHVTTAKTWYIVDATDMILGRMASTIAIHMRGKNLASYTPSVDMGGRALWK